jgi:hypothetical protein
VLRTLLTRLGLPARILYVPASLARPAARALALLYRAVGSRRPPLLTPYTVQQLSKSFTLNISAGRRDLGYSPTHTFRDGPLTGDEDGAGMLQFPEEHPCRSIHKPPPSSRPPLLPVSRPSRR